MRYVSLFSGVEAASVAWSKLGWEPLAFAEVDEFPAAVLACRFPNVPNLGDVCKIDWRDFHERYGAVDVLIGGSPCQSFSVAGNRTGLEGASGLMWQFCRAIRELVEYSGGGRLDTCSGRTFQELSQAAPKARRGRISDACSESWKSAGMVWHGEFWTASLPEYQTGQRLDSQGRYRNAAGASSLSEVLVATAPAKYSLSARACEGIIRRAEKRVKPLPEILRKALEWVIARDSSTTRGGGAAKGIGYEVGSSPTLTADYHQPAIMFRGDATPKFSEDVSMTLRKSSDYHDHVLTPWDVQSKRVNTPEGTSPTLPSGTGEGMNIQPIVMTTANTNAVAFTQNQRDEVRLEGLDGSLVGSLHTGSGKNEHFVMSQFGEVAGTLRARGDSSPNADGGQNVVCMQDGQANGAVEEDLSSTLNASHEQPIVCAADDNGKTAIEEDLCGSLKVGGGVALNSNGEGIVGALCARDYKGVGNEYVNEGKVICQKHTC